MLNITPRLITLFLIFFIFSCQTKNSSNIVPLSVNENISGDNQKLDTVPVKLISLQNFNREIISQGKIESKYRSDVSFEIESIIKHIGIEIGQRVKKGQLLATLEDFTFINDLEKIEQNIASAKLNIEKKLITLGFEPNQEIDKALEQRLAVEFQLNQFNIDKKLILYNLEKCKIKAPISGVITELIAQTGNKSSDFEKLCTIVDDSNFQVVFPVLEAELNLVKPNNSISFHPLYQAEKIFQGRINIITPEVNEYGMINTFAKVKPNKYLYEGMKVKVYIQDQIPNQLVVPKSAVVDRQGKQVVFSYKNRVAHWNYVKIGEENAHSYTINEGLFGGDTIITENNLLLAHLQNVFPVLVE